MKNQKYEVSVKVKGYYSKNINAISEEEAGKLIEEAFNNADFKDLENVDMLSYNAQKNNDGSFNTTAVVTGFGSGSVIAKDAETAKALAEGLFYEEADYGELHDFDIEEVIITDII